MQSLALLLAVAFAIVSLLGTAHAAVSVSPAREGGRCQFPDGAAGRCEKMVSCLKDEGVVRRNGSIVLCGNGNPLELLACCRRPYSVANEMCSVWARYWLKRTSDRSLTCTSITPLIGGGEEAGLGEFPNMAALGDTNGEKGNKTHPNWFCGGSLITPSFVLTAAHCLYNDIEYYRLHLVVGLGEHDQSFRVGGTLPRLNEGMPEGMESAAGPGEDSAPVEQWIGVSDIYTYPEHQFRQKYHDIALLRLKQPAVLTQRVLPVCLPTLGLGRVYTSESEFTAAGWGNFRFGTALEYNPSGRKLQKVVINYVGAIECAHDPAWKRNPYSYPRLGITTDIICAGAPMKDTCSGDSGGPLMQKAELPTVDGPCQPMLVAGVVSGGPYECGSLGLYTRVSSYIDWITGIVAPGVLPAQA